MTHYHTPIALGAPGTPDTVNTPLALLDTAIFGAYAQVAALTVGTGNVATLRMQNVRDYGAVGNGIADDTTAIAAAIAAASGGTVYFPPGTYLSGLITVSLGVSIVGAGRGLSILKNSNTAGQHFLRVTANNVTVSGMTIHGNRAAQLANSGSAVQVAGTGGPPMAAVTGFSIVDCDVYGCGFDGIGFSRVESGRVASCNIYDCYDCGIDIVEGSKRIGIVGNYIETAARYGIGVDTADTGNYAACSDITIADNVVVCDSGADVRWGIYLETCKRITVSGNSIDCSAGAVQGGIRVCSDAAGVTVSGNTVLGSAAATIAGISVDGSAVLLKYASIMGNLVQGFTGANIPGIGIYQANGVTVSGNIALGNARGIDLEAAAGTPTLLTVTGNIAETNGIGIRFGGGAGAPSAVVTGNQALNNSTYNWAFDPAWVIYFSGPPRVSAYYGGASFLPADGGPAAVPVLASASPLTLPLGNLITVTGTTNFTSITASWPGRIVVLQFTGILTITDGSNLKLAGSFTTSADDTLTLACDGTNWYEVCRSVN